MGVKYKLPVIKDKGVVLITWNLLHEISLLTHSKYHSIDYEIVAIIASNSTVMHPLIGLAF